MKRMLWAAAVMICWASWAGTSAAANETPDTPATPEKLPARPNIIFCLTDDQGWGDVAYNGHPDLKTPVLDTMASQGLRFDRFYAAAPVCSPTRGSVLTGRTPNRYGCYQWGYHLPSREKTIAQALGSAGYATAHFGKWHLGSLHPRGRNHPGVAGFEHWVSSPNFYENDPLFSRGGQLVQLKGEGSRATVDVAMEFIEECAAKQQPFLAMIWFAGPHVPYQASDELRAMYAEHPEELANYYGEITGIDQAMGHLRAELRRLGIADNTLLWFASDNGATGAGSTGGLRGRKSGIYEGGLRVPAIIEWPAVIRTPRQTKLACSTVDVYPTLLELAGVEVSDQPPLDGESLVPLLRGAMDQRSPLGFWNYPAQGHRTPSRGELEALKDVSAEGPPEQEPEVQLFEAPKLLGHAAWLDGDWKLHRLAPPGTDQVTWELYHLADDPQETKNLIESEPQRVAEMRAALEGWLASVVHSLRGNDSGYND